MKINALDISMFAGIASATVGVSMQFGIPWGMIACGALLMAMTMLSMAQAR